MERKPVYQTGASPFDAIRQVEDGREFWSARELMPLLGYAASWQNFENVIKEAMIAASEVELNLDELFNAVIKKPPTGRPQKDYFLTKRACYLIAQNGDPRKSEIAAAMNYFSAQTQWAETVQEQLAQPVQPEEPPLQGSDDFLAYVRKQLNVPSLEVLRASEQELHTFLQYIHAAKKMHAQKPQKDHIGGSDKMVTPKQLPAPETDEYIQLEIMRHVRRRGPLPINVLRTSYMKEYGAEILEEHADVLVEQGRLYSFKTSHTTKYAIVESASDVS